MKQLLSILLATAILTTGVVAATPAPTASEEPTDTPATTPKQALDDLKERLATKVAELRQSQRKAIFGTIKSVSISTATIETTTSDVKIELTDEIKVAQIIKGQRSDLTTEDLAKDDIVVVFGDYDSGLELLKAKAIFIQATPPQRISGTVTDVDSDEFTVTIKSADEQTWIIDIEKNTVTNIWTKEKGIAKGGFSKIVAGDTVHVVGTPVAKKENQLSGIRILDIGNVAGTTPTPTEEPEEEASPTATAKPTAKTTPTPTKKTTPTPTP